MGGLIQGLFLGAIGAAHYKKMDDDRKNIIRNELFWDFHLQGDVRYKQELLLEIASFPHEKYSFFTISDLPEWLPEIRSWFSSLNIQDGLNAYDVLLTLMSDYETFSKGQLIVEYFDNDKGTPKPSTTNKIIELLSQYWQEYNHKERIHNPQIDERLYQYIPKGKRSKERIKADLHREFCSNVDIKRKQEIILALSTYTHQKFSFFTHDDVWLIGIRQWLLSFDFPYSENAYDVLLCLISDKTTHDVAAIIPNYFDTEKGNPKVSTTNSCCESLSRYWREYTYKERIHEPCIDEYFYQNITTSESNGDGTIPLEPHTIVNNNAQDVNKIVSVDNYSSEGLNQQNQPIYQPNAVSSQQVKPMNSATVGSGNHGSIHTTTEISASVHASNNVATQQATVNVSQGGSQATGNIVAKANEGNNHISDADKSHNCTCPNCKTRIPTGSSFCYKCGYKIELIFCPECGKQIDASTKDCPNCGYPIQEMLSPLRSND